MSYKLYLWGDNSISQLGDSTLGNQSSPLFVAQPINTISAGGYHTIGTSGVARTYVGCGDNGQFQLTNFGTDGTITAKTPFRSLSNDLPANIIQVEAGLQHSLYLTLNGTVAARGNDSYGQVSSLSFVNGQGPYTKISAGNYHNIALNTIGQAYIWGRNNYGQIGTTTTSTSNTALISLLSQIIEIAAGDYHTAIITGDNRLFLCGLNNRGQLGNGTLTNSSSFIAIDGTWSKVSLGTQHSAAINLNGDLYTWGYNLYGQLGIGNTTNQSLPQLVARINGHAWTEVSAGNGYTLAINANNDVYAWGWNNTNQLGDGTTTNRTLPTKIISAGTFGFPVAIKAGPGFHSAALFSDIAVTTTTTTTTTLAPVNYTWTPRTSNQNWSDIKSSSNGNNVIASVHGGQIYISNNGGISWTPTESNRNWKNVAISDDGTKLVASVGGFSTPGRIYFSLNSGTSWLPTAIDADWTGLAISSNGSKMVAVAQANRIYLSINDPTTWTPTESIRSWFDVAMSSDGMVIAAIAYRNIVYISTDGGNTWLSRPIPGVQRAVCIAISGNGSKIAVGCDGDGVEDEPVYITNDLGLSWAPATFNSNWRDISINYDGSKILATHSPQNTMTLSEILYSTNGGVTWNDITPFSSFYWNNIHISSLNTEKLFASNDDGAIYTGSVVIATTTTTAAPTTTTAAPTTTTAAPTTTTAAPTTTTAAPIPNQWIQVGNDIDGEAAGDNSGRGVSINSTGNILAVGAPYNDGNGLNSGHVRVYVWNGTSWTQRGSDIDGEAAGDNSGYSVSLNSTGDILAIGAIGNDASSGFSPSGGLNSGHVRVYAWNGTSWTQRGSDIDGEATGDQSGWGVSLNSTGDILAVSARYNDGNGLESGHVRVYAWNGTSWTQRGSDIDGEATGDQSGHSVSLNSTGDILAVGARYNSGNGLESGHVRVYAWNGTSWTQRGSDIDGEATGDFSGWSVSLNSTGDILAIGAVYNDGNGQDSGHVRVYAWNGTSWTQRGSDIDGEATGDFSGWSVSLNSTGDILAIGAIGNDANGAESGHVRVYAWNGTSWTQRGSDIDGEATGDQSGWGVSLNSTGNILAVSALQNDGNGANSGSVRVYSFGTPPPPITTTTTTTTTTVRPQIVGSCSSRGSFARIQLRRATDGQFISANTILASGEPGYATDTRVIKVGDGYTTWANLLPVQISGTLALPTLLSSNNINISQVDNTYIVEATGVAQEVHTHVAADITDLNDAINTVTAGFTPIGHTHSVNDITDISSTYTQIGHTHVAADITDLASANPLQIGTISTGNPPTASIDTGGSSPLLNITFPAPAISWKTPPVAQNADGIAGDIAYDSGHFYVATANQTWKRVAFDNWVVTDPYFSGVKLLLHLDSSYDDFSSSSKTVTPSNMFASIYNNDGRFFGASFQYNDAYISAPASTDWDFGTDAFTVQLWLKILDSATPPTTRTRLIGTDGWGLYVTPDTVQSYFGAPLNLEFVVFDSGGSITYRKWGGPIELNNEWRYIDVERFTAPSNTISITNANNGLGYAYPALSTVDSWGTDLTIGGTPSGSLDLCYIDEVRITKGITRATQSAPTAPFPNS